MFFKDRVVIALDTISAKLTGIRTELISTRCAIQYQTRLLEQKKETPKEAEPAPKAITWQEAARVLQDLCSKKTVMECDDGCCPMRQFCARYLWPGKSPDHWEVPADE